MNYLYGILTNGVVTEDIPGFRYTDVMRSNASHRLLDKIISDKTPVVVAAKADLIINLMRSMPCWVSFINEFDPINTYEEKVYPVYGVIPENFKDQLNDWVNNLKVNNDRYQISIHDDFIQKLINSFYIIATTK